MGPGAQAFSLLLSCLPSCPLLYRLSAMDSSPHTLYVPTQAWLTLEGGRNGNSLNARLMSLPGEIFSGCSAPVCIRITRTPHLKRYHPILPKSTEALKPESWVQNMWPRSPVTRHLGTLDFLISVYSPLGIYTNYNLTLWGRESFGLKIRHHVGLDLERKLSTTFKTVSCP